MKYVLSTLLLAWCTTTCSWFLYDEQGEKQPVRFSQIPISQKIPDVRERRRLEHERLDLEKEIEELEKELQKQIDRCQSIEETLESMSVPELAQESKRAYLPCAMSIEQMNAKLQKLRKRHTEIVHSLVQP